MREYKFRYSGSVGVQPLEFTGKNMNEHYAKDNVLRSLPNYWPTYYTAAIWDEHDQLVAEFESKITTVEVVRS
jgi:hypothetical protein